MKLVCALAAYSLGSNENRLYWPIVNDSGLNCPGIVWVYATVDQAKLSLVQSFANVINPKRAAWLLVF